MTFIDNDHLLFTQREGSVGLLNISNGRVTMLGEVLNDALNPEELQTTVRLLERSHSCRAVVRRNAKTPAGDDSSNSGRRSATRNASCTRSSASSGDAPSTRT